MTDQEIVAKLQQAQDLLSDVYHHACQTGDTLLESFMSSADTCIVESLNHLE
jgi:hypothetical protein